MNSCLKRKPWSFKCWTKNTTRIWFLTISKPPRTIQKWTKRDFSYRIIWLLPLKRNINFKKKTTRPLENVFATTRAIYVYETTEPIVTSSTTNPSPFFSFLLAGFLFIPGNFWRKQWVHIITITIFLQTQSKGLSSKAFLTPLRKPFVPSDTAWDNCGLTY